MQMKSEAHLYKQSLDVLTDAFFLHDMQGKIVDVNQQSCRSLGYTRDELLNMSVSDIEVGADQEKLKRLWPILEKDGNVRIEGIHRRKDGTTFPVEVCLGLVKTDGESLLSAVVRDTTKRKKIENELEYQNNYLQNLLRISRILSGTGNLDDILMALMSELLIIFQVDRAWLLYPCDPEADFWSVPVEATVPEYPGAFSLGKSMPVNKLISDIFYDALSARKPLINDFHEGVEAPDQNENFNVKTQMTIALFPKNDHAWMLGMHQCSEHRTWDENDKRLFNDIALRVTDMLTQRLLLNKLEAELKLRKHAQQELLEAIDEVESADLAKSEFLSRMSHELRTPMNAILGFGQLLNLDSSELNENQQDNVKEILGAGHHLLELINEVLDLAKIESGEVEVVLEPVHLDDILQQCLSLIRSQAESRHIKLIDNVTSKGYILRASYTRLKQVLVNLLSNAVKYNSEHGSITLDCEIIEKDYLYVRISDTGRGLTEEEINKLFMPFERLDAEESIEGTGIGLTITKHLVELMDGSIGIESKPGEGSTFWIKLALEDDEKI